MYGSNKPDAAQENHAHTGYGLGPQVTSVHAPYVSAPTAPVESELKQLECDLDEAHRRIEELATKLRPVLSKNESAQDILGAPPCGSSEVALTISSSSQSVRSLTRKIGYLLGQVEL